MHPLPSSTIHLDSVLLVQHSQKLNSLQNMPEVIPDIKIFSKMHHRKIIIIIKKKQQSDSLAIKCQYIYFLFAYKLQTNKDP